MINRNCRQQITGVIRIRISNDNIKLISQHLCTDTFQISSVSSMMWALGISDAKSSFLFLKKFSLLGKIIR